MVYKTPAAEEDENDAEELDHLQDDAGDDEADQTDTVDFSARSKGPALDFSSYADPIDPAGMPSSPSPKAAAPKPRASKPALDFSSKADPISVPPPKDVPLPRARPEQPDLFADVPLPKARPDEAPDRFDTQLSAADEAKFQIWKSKYAPNDSGADYDLRGAFKAGFVPDENGHWDDKFKKPNHPTFSTFSQYAKVRPDLAGTWDGDNYIPPAGATRDVPLPSPRPDLGPNPAGPGDVNALDDVPLSKREGYLGGGILGDAGALTPEQAQAEREARIGGAKAAEDTATATRKKMETDFGPELERLNMARKSLNLPPLTAEQVQHHAVGAAVEAEAKAAAATREARNEPLPTMTAPRAAAERAAKAVAGGIISIPSYLYEASQYAGKIIGASDEELKNDTLAQAVKKAADISKKSVEAALPGDVARDKDFWTAQVSQGFGSSVGFMAGGIAGKVMGFSNQAIGALVAAMGAAQQGDQGLEEFDKAVERLGDKLGKEDVRAWKRLAVFITNSGLGATEAIPIANALERINSLTGGLVTRLTLNAGIQSLEEMTQEIGQQVGQNTVAKLLYDYQRDIFQGVPDAGAVAAVLGFFQGGGLHAAGELSGARGARTPTPYIDLPQPEEIERQARGEAPARGEQEVPAAATAPAGPNASGRTAEAAGGPHEPVGSSAVAASNVSAIERRILRKKGYLDDQIDGMNRAEAEAELGEAAEQGIAPDAETADEAAVERPAAVSATADQPTAEPASDIAAQAQDLRDRNNDRKAVWLPAATVEHLRGTGQLDAVLAAGVPMENFDGEGGILIAKDKKIARTARKLHTQKVALQAIIGGLTGDGLGKPADAQTVVQQTDAAGNVTQETAVSPGEGPAVAAAMAEPGRTVQEKPVAQALAERAGKVAGEQQAADFSSQGVPAEGAGTRESPAKVNDPLDVSRAEGRVNTEPTEAQKEAGNYKKGHVRWNGLNVTIENPKGSTRSGTDANGQSWQVEMPAAYGYIKRSKGKDGDQVDVYLGPQHDAAHAFIIDQYDPQTGKFDEHKVMLGFADQASAEQAYDAAFTDGSGPARRRAVSPVTVDELKKWLRSGKTKIPFAKPAAQPAPDGAAVLPDFSEQADPALTRKQVENKIVTDLREALLQPVEMQAEDSDETVTVRLTEKGPWDFNDTFPAPDFENVAARHMEGRTTFEGDDGEMTVEGIVSAIEESINEIIGYLSAARAMRQKIADIRSGKEKLKRGQSKEKAIEAAESEMARAAQSLRDFAGALQDGFTRDGVAAMVRHARGILASEKPPAQTAAEKKAETRQAPETGPSDSEQPKAENPAAALASKFADHLRDGGDFKNILAARKMAKEAGFDGDAKAVEEAMELAVVTLGREIAAGTEDPKAKFTALVDLYSRQPKLGTRTSTSMRDQAFSTPIPLAFVASRLASIDDMEAEVIYEPTAGNGALLIEANASPDIGAKTVIANEINPQRADNLRSIGGLLKGVKADKQGFLVTSVDATDPSQAKVIRQEMDGADRVIANPPFGAVRQENESKVFDLSDIQKGYQTKEIDHAIALRALSALRDDGKAVLLLGGINKLATTREARSDAYNGKAKREFYKVLYDRYNVTDHFTVSGDLYERQGAGWPVDVIVIDGRGASKRALPAVDVPRVLSSWDQLGGLLDAVPATGDRQTDGAAERVAEAGSRERDGRVRGAGERVSKREPETGQREPVQPGSSERAGNERSGDQGRGERPQRAERGNAERAGAEPAAERRPSGLDDFDAAFDQALDQTFGPQVGPKSSEAPAAPRARTTGAVARSAVSNAVESADAAMAGLVQLFGGNKVSSGISFDEETYAKAKPLFQTAAQKFVAFKDDVAELVRRMVGEMQRVHGLTRDALEAMRPYLRRFMEELKAGAVSLTGAKKPAAKPAAKSAPAEIAPEQETATQVTYAPKSAVDGLGTLVPVNMRTPISESLAALEARVGNLDTYVADQLGYEVDDLATYFAAEQVDALALAIDNLERGKGFIIGDQTGIGKGRVNAAVIRWAIKRGRIPVFVTEKPNLYRDMYRDLTDIGIQQFLGQEPRILATNSDLTVPLTEDGGIALKTGSSSDHGRLLGAMTAKKFAGSYDMVFTTYSQMQTVAGKDTTRRAFLSGIAPNAVLIFDESHNAGGQGKAAIKTKGPSNRSGFARDLVASANGVFYSSATYAKRPDVMDLYSATDMVMAVEKVADLAEAIARGGVPMQQVVASMLARAGQYIRRERSFAGITYDTVITQVNHEQYDGISRALAEIQDFSLIVQDAAKNLDEQIKAQASAISSDNATGSAGASSVLFTSIMHNIVNQMLLAMKSNGAAQQGIEAIKRGEKPIFTVANTMESFLSDFAEAAGIKHGEVLDADFSQVLQKYLDRTRTLIVKKPFSKQPVERIYLSDAELGNEGVEAYRRAKEAIDGLDLADLPVSPIDRIKQDLADAGYRVGEITGRGTIIDYSGDAPVIRGRPTRETSIRGRIETNDAFNSGEIDAIVLNQSGSTGISLHASEKFKDQRKRFMLIVQPEGNIDTQMQLLGRPNRTGQVVKPAYGQLVADIPAEKRPAAVLAKKMASLNANTTASRGGALTAKDVPDFLNEYGDTVAATIIADDYVLNARLGNPVKIDENGKIEVEDAMRRLTGRIPLLPLKEQEELYARLEEDYAALLEQMEAAGENALEAKTLDFKARALERVEVVPAKSGSKSPFAAPVYIEKTSIVRQGKPFSAPELVHKLTDALGVETGGFGNLIPKAEDDATAAEVLADVNEYGGALGRVAFKQNEAARTAAITDFTAFVREELDGLVSPEKQEKERTKLYAVKDRWEPLHAMLPTGARITLKTNSGNIAAIVIKTERTGETKNPLALSSWKATFAVADAARQVTLPFSRLYLDGKSPESDKTAIEIRAVGWDETPAQTIERFAMMQNSAREERYIATGNLLAAYDWLNMKGRIINYTDEEGHIRQGILTAKGFDVAKHFETKAKPVRDPALVAAWLKNNPGKPMWSEDDVVRLSLENRRFFIATEAAKRTGGVYFLDKELTSRDMAREFYKYGGVMKAEVFEPSDALMTKIIARMQELGAVFVDRTQSKLPPAEKLAEKDKASIGRTRGTQEAINSFRLTRQAEAKRLAIESVIRDAIRQVAGRSVAARAQISDRVTSSNLNSDWGSAAPSENNQYMLTGVYSPATDLIRVALQDNPDAVVTAYHEGWHAIEGTLTAEEVDLLRRETERLRAYVAARRSDMGIEQAAAEEVWAEAAAQYVNARTRSQSISGIHIAVRRIFEKIRQLLARIRSALNGMGFRSAEDIFERFSRGQMAARREGLPPDMRRRWWSETPFAKWFKNSKVIDRNGKPLVVYHGTKADITSFDPAKMGKDTGAPSATLGFFFTDRKATAKYYARAGVYVDLVKKKRKYLEKMASTYDEIGHTSLADQYRDDIKNLPQPNVVPVYLSLQNPLVHNFRGRIQREETFYDLLQKAKAEGHDGAIFRNTYDSGQYNRFDAIARGHIIPETVYVVFDPSQIKHATENSGDFEPGNNDIRASIRRRAPGPDDLLPPPETVADAWAQVDLPIRQRLSDAVDALLLDPARAIWDRQIDLLRFQKASEAMGRRVGEGLDTYLAATLYPGKVGERMKDAVKALWNPLYDEMKERGVGRDELHDYLYARHAPERNAKIREIDPDNDAGSGMTDDEAAEIMGALADRKADFEAVAAQVDKIVAANRDVILREGLENERTIANWEGAYRHYVPLKGFEAGSDDEILGTPSSGRGFDVRRPETMRALGRFDRADDILTNLLDQTQRTIIRAEKNKVAKTFLRFAQANPSPFYKIGLAEKKRRINPLTGLAEEYWANLPTHLDRVSAAKVGGKTYYVEIKHDGLLEALKSLGADKMNAFLRLMSRLTREYSRFQTAKNPEFVFTNLIRDLQDAGFTVTAEQQKNYTKRFMANIANGKALFGAILGTADVKPDSAYRRWYDEWREAGGKISHYGLKDMEELRKEVERELGQRTESTGKSLAMAPLRMVNPINGKFVKFLEALSDVTESTTRLAVYISGREIGLTKAQAARMSRGATVDFNRRGVHGSVIGALYAFANANIQGNVRLLRVLRKSKVARRGALAIVIAGMLMTYWNMAVSPEDEEKKRAYEKRKYWERERNIIIYWPGSKTAAKIPLGYGLNVFWMMGEQIAMRMLGKVGTAQAIGNVLGTMVDAFNPTGSQGSFFDLETWAKGLFPTVFRPIPELALNKNWAGNPIHPDEMPWNQGLPHSSQHKAFTHPAAVSAAEFLNRVTGGNKFQPGAVSLYPDDVEYGWNFAVGGLGRFLANTSGAIQDYVEGIDRPVERVPFVRRFVASDNSPTVSSGAYYEKRRDEQVKARQLRAAIKSRSSGEDDGSADSVIEKLGEELQARPSKNGRGIQVPAESIFRDADKQIKALRQQEDAIRKDQSISRKDRAEQIRALRDDMREVMGRARQSIPSPQSP